MRYRLRPEGDVPDLAGFRSRLDRAATLHRSFAETWATYLDQRPHEFRTEVDDTGTGTLLLRRTIPLPDELPLILGEFLYQLRSALDNCLYAVAVIDSGTNPPPGADLLQWPICETPALWKKARGRYRYLRADLIEALDAIQPYNADFPTWNSLHLLHDLARIDRHRTLHVVTLVPVETRIRLDRGVISDVEVHTGEIADGGAVVTFRYAGEEPIGPAHIDGDFEFEVELADVEASEGPTGAVTRP